jgi:hypothetical protein
MSTNNQPRQRFQAAATAIAFGLIAAACSATTSPAGSAPATSGGAATRSPASMEPSVTATTAPATALPAPSGTAAADTFDPSLFPAGATVTNPWFPLIPGTVFISRGTKDGKAAVDRVTVTDRTKDIAGVTTRVVEDRLTLDGVLHERTTDYYAQDQAGNVWYVGEDTAELDDHGNVVNRDGTWHAGVDGAIPGIYMEADPQVGHAFRQEFYPGQAEDHFEVVGLTAKVDVPFGAFDYALRTKEWTPLEPDVLDNKFYVHGVGQVREVAVKGPKEELSLVSIKKP